MNKPSALRQMTKKNTETVIAIIIINVLFSIFNTVFTFKKLNNRNVFTNNEI